MELHEIALMMVKTASGSRAPVYVGWSWPRLGCPGVITRALVFVFVLCVFGVRFGSCMIACACVRACVRAFRSQSVRPGWCGDCNHRTAKEEWRHLHNKVM